MKKVIAFDLDDTLAPSKSTLPPRIGELLSELLETYRVCVISGGKFGQFETQLLDGLNVSDEKLEKLHIMPTCGTRYYRFENGAWALQYAEDFTEEEKQKIIDVLYAGADELGYRETEVYGDVIEDRGSQITFSALGQDIVMMLGEEGLRRKRAWDPDLSKKKALQAYAAQRLPEFTVHVGGITSVDVTKPGIDKAYGMRKLLDMLELTKEDVLFYGDRLIEGGNDYPVKAMGIESIAVEDWEDTARKLEALLAS